MSQRQIAKACLSDRRAEKGEIALDEFLLAGVQRPLRRLLYSTSVSKNSRVFWAISSHS